MENREKEFVLIRHFKVTVGSRVYEVAVEEAGEVSNKGSASQTIPPSSVPQKTEPAQTIKREVQKKTEGGGAILCPMPAKVILIKCKIGDRVRCGEALLVIEAMKMEHTLCAPGDGVVLEIKASEGESVGYNQPLLLIG
jgi:biotin carboxyl carrier protein